MLGSWSELLWDTFFDKIAMGYFVQLKCVLSKLGMRRLLCFGRHWEAVISN